MRLIRFWQKPHPFIFNTSSVLVPFFVTLLVLMVFKPFQFADFAFWPLVRWSLLFAGIVVFCVYGVMLLVTRVFSEQWREENWTVGKEVMLVLTVIASIALVVFLLFYWQDSTANAFELFQLVFFRTLLISIFPVLILVLFEQYHYQKIKHREAVELNNLLLDKPHETSNSPDLNHNSRIRILAENDKVVLQVESALLIFARAAGNYVEVFYWQNDQVKKELVRNKLKNIANQLPTDVFIRCHKSYLVNSNHILKVNGNARNLELWLVNCNEKIPVSRSKSEMLAELIKK